jgi:L-proline amide hydrolase
MVKEGYPVIFYDQAGCGKSTRIDDPAADAPWLYKIDYYVEEFFEVVASYGPLSGYYIYGHSWGTIVGQVKRKFMFLT